MVVQGVVQDDERLVEPLVGSLQGMYSRRIDRQHRFVYEVIEGELEEGGVAYEGIVRVLSMWTHYESF
ncbi:MAG: type II toxin-antitoxin system YoeB family toxin [Slackia sp.]|uniref:type II toxin-antitoxin system YoeB family toxin n=1 Tax=uncultured Slackia sp. TaxID=665903 RepID=UPI002803E612|nr:type II toxin-antitoxin system YoeB family toxin [uncultured Slackia sp.]MDU6011242.1 type II toxin-antitoxin system YoeB family toxin [Slackia sp.]